MKKNVISNQERRGRARGLTELNLHKRVHREKAETREILGTNYARWENDRYTKQQSKNRSREAEGYD